MIKVKSYAGLRHLLTRTVAAVPSVFIEHTEVGPDTEKSVPKIVHAAPARMNSRPRKIRMAPGLPIPFPG